MISKGRNILKIVYVAFGSLQARDQQYSIRLMSKFAGNSMCRSICSFIIKVEICSYLARDAMYH
jgi:hypothetical protein